MKIVSSNVSTNEPMFISPKELAIRWCCSRSSVDRIARRAKLTRIYLGVGRNGIVRYLCKEIQAYELERTLKIVN